VFALAGGNSSTQLRRWPSGNPRLNAFCRSAPAVRFIALAIFLTGDLFRECALSSRTSAFEINQVRSFERQHDNLSSTIRLFVLEFYRKQLSKKEGHTSRKIPLPRIGNVRRHSPRRCSP
jgi:hypothetical protein